MKKKLGVSLLLSSLLFGSFLALFIGTVGYIYYNDGMLKKTNEYAESIINLIINRVDVERFKEAVDKSKRTEEIVNIERVCDDIKQTHNIEYVYIVKPLNLNETDNISYILTGEPKEDREKGYSIAVGELSGDEYTPDVVEYYMKAMNDHGKLSFFTNTTLFGYMYTGMKAIVDTSGKGVAIVAVDINMDDILATKRKYLVLIFSASVIIAVIFVVLMYAWLFKRIIKPINSIEKASNDFVALSHKNIPIEELLYRKPKITTGDEIESLSNSVDIMSTDLKNYMISIVKTEGEKNRIAGELNAATHIQSSMLPCIFPAFPNDARFDIHASMTPAKEVGGDFYDFFMVDDKHLAIVVADVSGKGVPAALFMVIGKTLIKDHTTLDNDLGKTFEEVNNLLCEANSEGLFITAFEAVINLETGHVTYVNAGHEMPFIYRKGKEFNAFEMKAAFVLAGMEGMKYKAGELTIEHGDKIFQYTDGVTEATNTKNELYGMDRLKQALDANVDKNPSELLKAVKTDIDKFVGEAPQFDDITMLGFEFK